MAIGEKADSIIGAQVPIQKESPTPSALLKLNLGCGAIQPTGWVNVDGSNRAWLVTHLPLFDRALVALRLIPPTEFNSKTFYTNLERVFPWRDNTIDIIYMGELLEHFTRENGEIMLRECFRVLKPETGILRVRVPDNFRFWSQYVEQFNHMRQRPRIDWTLDHTRWIDIFFSCICTRRELLRPMGTYHKWMYDEISLIKTFENVGFRNVERMAYHQSRIPDVSSVEVRGELLVEGTKP